MCGDLYNEHSALSRLVRVLGDVVSEPVSASVTQAGSSDESTLTQHDIGVAAVKVYDRSRDLIEHVADEAGVDAVLLGSRCRGGTIRRVRIRRRWVG